MLIKFCRLLIIFSFLQTIIATPLFADAPRNAMLLDAEFFDANALAQHNPHLHYEILTDTPEANLTELSDSYPYLLDAIKMRESGRSLTKKEEHLIEAFDKAFWKKFLYFGVRRKNWSMYNLSRYIEDSLEAELKAIKAVSSDVYWDIVSLNMRNDRASFISHATEVGSLLKLPKGSTIYSISLYYLLGLFTFSSNRDATLEKIRTWIINHIKEKNIKIVSSSSQVLRSKFMENLFIPLAEETKDSTLWFFHAGNNPNEDHTWGPKEKPSNLIFVAAAKKLRRKPHMTLSTPHDTRVPVQFAAINSHKTVLVAPTGLTFRELKLTAETSSSFAQPQVASRAAAIWSPSPDMSPTGVLDALHASSIEISDGTRPYSTRLIPPKKAPTFISRALKRVPGCAKIWEQD